MPLPSSWSSLTWQQLMQCWQAKVRYAGNADVARAAALLDLLGLTVCRSRDTSCNASGETLFMLRDKDGGLHSATPREVAHYARTGLAWFDYPYGDAGDPEQKDEKGNVIRERRDAVPGYVSDMRDAMVLPVTETKVCGRWFALPQVACSNLTWQQYRAMQAVVPGLFGENADTSNALGLQAQFLSHALVQRTTALFDTSSGNIKYRRRNVYEYNADVTDQLQVFWKKVLSRKGNMEGVVLFHICFQCYQTAVQYYAASYPILFSDDGKKDMMRDALQSEVGTINTIMKYAGYSEQQQVYDSNLPFVLDILNTMAKEAKEIEKMNAKIKKK